MKFLSKFTITAAIAVLSAASGTAQAIEVTETSALNDLESALTAGNTGIVINSISISGLLGQFGTYTNTSGVYGIGPGVVISSGKVTNYSDGSNTSTGKSTGFGNSQTAAQKAILTPITGQTNHFDVAQIDIDFDLKAGFSSIFFNTVFGSEEFPQFVNTSFIDGFGLIINGENIASSGGLPVNINNPGFLALPGTELNGVLAPGGNPVVIFSKFLGDGSKGNKLTFIIADTSDTVLDSTAYFSALGGAVPQPPKPVPVPPAVAGVFVAGGLLSRRLFKRTLKDQNIQETV